MSRAVMQQALEALELSLSGEPIGSLEREAITALRAALAKSEQEPVAYCTYPKCQTTAAGCSGVCRQPAPAPRKPLSDEQIALIVGECAASAYQHDDFSFARAIERAHGIGEQQ